MVEVGKFDNRAEAELARSLLARPAHDLINLPGGARLLVAEADAGDAAAIFRHHVADEEDGR